MEKLLSLLVALISLVTSVINLIVVIKERDKKKGPRSTKRKPRN